MTTTKEKITMNIKNWLQLDKEIQVLQKELKDIKLQKKDLSKSLVEIMKSKEIDCFDISEGKIIYTKSNIKNAINKKYLMDCLDKYFEDNPNIPTDDIVKFILDNRAINTKESIRHKPIKN
jgi:seryl-tRNA synthetase